MKAGSSPISQRLDGGFDRQYIEYIKLVNAGPRHLHTLVLTAKDSHRLWITSMQSAHIQEPGDCWQLWAGDSQGRQGNTEDLG